MTHAEAEKVLFDAVMESLDFLSEHPEVIQELVDFMNKSKREGETEE